MILTAYYDESGTHAGSPVTVLAGFVGSTEDWVRFDGEWNKVLRKHKISHVHAKNLWHKNKLHKGWTDDQVELLWADLMYVFQENKSIFASRTILLEEDYRLFYLSDGPAKGERLDSRYGLCFSSFLHFHPAFHRDRYTRGAVNFVLEAGHKNAGDALRVFNEIKTDGPRWTESIGALSFGAKIDFPALQAADLLAYWSYRSEYLKLRENEFDDLISEFEWELQEDCGLSIIDHSITPENLMEMRKNFLRKRKKPVLLDKAKMDIQGIEVGPTSPYVGVRSS